MSDEQGARERGIWRESSGKCECMGNIVVGKSRILLILWRERVDSFSIVAGKSGYFQYFGGNDSVLYYFRGKDHVLSLLCLKIVPCIAFF